MLSRKTILVALAAAFLLAATASVAEAQREREGRERGERGERGDRGRGGFGRGGFGGFGGGGGLLDLVNRNDVQKELELLEDQVTQAREAVQQQRENRGNAFAQLRDLPEDQRRDRMRELFQKAQQDADKAVEDALLPHQAKRLHQLANQFRARGGPARALRDDEFASQVGVSEGELEKLNEVTDKVEDELREQMAKLRAEANSRILATLSPDQQTKWKDLMGEPFEFEAEERPSFGRGGGGFGGRGGARPQGRPGDGNDGGRPRGRN